MVGIPDNLDKLYYIEHGVFVGTIVFTGILTFVYWSRVRQKIRSGRPVGSLTNTLLRIAVVMLILQAITAIDPRGIYGIVTNDWSGWPSGNAVCLGVWAMFLYTIYAFKGVNAAALKKGGRKDFVSFLVHAARGLSLFLVLISNVRSLIIIFDDKRLWYGCYLLALVLVLLVGVALFVWKCRQLKQVLTTHIQKLNAHGGVTKRRSSSVVGTSAKGNQDHLTKLIKKLFHMQVLLVLIAYVGIVLPQLYVIYGDFKKANEPTEVCDPTDWNITCAIGPLRWFFTIAVNWLVLYGGWPRDVVDNDDERSYSENATGSSRRTSAAAGSRRNTATRRVVEMNKRMSTELNKVTEEASTDNTLDGTRDGTDDTGASSPREQLWSQQRKMSARGDEEVVIKVDANLSGGESRGTSVGNSADEDERLL